MCYKHIIVSPIACSPEFLKVAVKLADMSCIGATDRHTVCPEGDFLEKIKFIENHIIGESLVEPIYAEFHEDSIKVHFKTLK